jgi:hypothetical protein
MEHHTRGISPLLLHRNEHLHFPLADPGVPHRIRRLAARVGSRDDRFGPHGRLAQRLERLLYTEMVGGSNPSSPTTPTRFFSQFGLVAQLVRAPPCHGGGRGFKSHPGRQTKNPPVPPGDFLFGDLIGILWSRTAIRPSHGGGKARAARRAATPQWGVGAERRRSLDVGSSPEAKIFCDLIRCVALITHDHRR